MNPAALLPAGTGIEDVIVAMTAISTFLVIFAVWRALLMRDPMTSRLKALARRREGLREEMLATRRRSSGELRAEHVNFMRSVIDRFNLMRSSITDQATLKLENAGWRSRDALIAYVFFKFILPIAAGIGALLFFHGLNPYNMEPLVRTFCSLALVLLVAYAPDIYIKNAIDKRRAAMQKGLPDALDLMVICAEAGLSLDSSLARVSREIGPAHPELADELALTSVELGFLPERAKALENLARRAGLASIRGLVNTLMQTEKYGTPLSNSLRVLSSEFRNERMLKAEAKAARLPAILTVPMIVFIMPALFVVLLGTAIIRTIDGLGGLMR
jgi:tight adherence protein C